MAKYLHIGNKNNNTDYQSWAKEGYFKGGSHVSLLISETEDKTKIQYYPKVEYGPDETVLAVAGGAYKQTLRFVRDGAEIDWGDGVVEKVDTKDKDSIDVTHQYEDNGGGVRTLTVKGDFYDFGSQNALVGVYQIGRCWYVQSGRLSYKNNLAWIDAGTYRYNHLYGPNWIPSFGHCKKLKTIPDGLFDGYVVGGYVHMSNMFNDCISLEHVPEGIFSKLVLKAPIQYNLGFANMFYGCTSLREFPKGLLDDLSSYTRIDSISRMFINCIQLTGIPDGYFDSLKYCMYFDSSFSGCVALEHIFENLFANCYAISNCSYMFNGCKNLKSDKIFYVHVKDDTMDEEVPIFDYVVDPKYKAFREKYGGTTPRFEGMLKGCDSEKITWLRPEADKRGWGKGGPMDPLGGVPLPPKK